MQTKIKTKIKV